MLPELISIDSWLNTIKEKLFAKFDKKILFIGLQGSYSRDEATPESDIDVVVILDNLNFDDLIEYKKIISAMPHADKACGFVSGKKELKNWSKTDLFQFYYDTKSLYGDLNTIIQPPTKNDILVSMKTGVENLYHYTCHSFLHHKDLAQVLPSLYKQTFFILQAQYFLEQGKYITTKKELYGKLNSADKEILGISMKNNNFSSLTKENIDDLYKNLLKWCSSKI